MPTEDEIRDAIERAGPGLGRYLGIMERFLRVNVAQDGEFQIGFNGFYRIRQRGPEFYQAYYTFLEEHRGNVPAFTEVLEYLYQFDRHRLEASFASKLLATLDPNLPVWDRYVLEHLGMEAPARGLGQGERIRQAGEIYNRIIRWYEGFIPGDDGHRWIHLFDERYPDANITPVKKIDLILWQLR